MDIDLPSDDNSSDDDSVFGGRIALYEAYWLYVAGVRCVGPVLKQSPATKEDTDRSPLARHYNHFYEKKEEHKKKCRDLPGSLPEYKDHFEEPRGDVRKVPRENLAGLGIDWEEGDDPIWLPPEYELPPVWENDLESMGEPELRDLIRTLRSEKEELRDERDTLKETLAEVRRSLSSFLNSPQTDEEQDEQMQSLGVPDLTCEHCGRSFDTKSGRYGHKPHCSGSSSRGSNRKKADKTELEQLAEGLPKLGDEQSTESHENVSPEEELENLNHLLQGSL